MEIYAEKSIYGESTFQLSSSENRRRFRLNQIWLVASLYYDGP